MWDDAGALVAEIRIEIQPATDALIQQVEEKQRRKKALAKGKVHPPPPVLVGLEVTVAQGRGFPTRGSGSPPTTVVSIAIGDVKHETAPTEGTDPEWTEANIFNLTLQPPTLRMEVCDSQPGGPGRLGLALMTLDARLYRELQRGYVELLVPVRHKREEAGSICLGLTADFDGENLRTLHVTVIEAKGLRAEEEGRAVSPLVALAMGSQRFTTAAKSRTSEPVWGERFGFEVAHHAMTVRTYAEGASGCHQVGEGEIALDERMDRELRVRSVVERWVPLHHEGGGARGRSTSCSRASSAWTATFRRKPTKTPTHRIRRISRTTCGSTRHSTSAVSSTSSPPTSPGGSCRRCGRRCRRPRTPSTSAPGS
eukprot:TRINITY_DN16362_c0_g1_i1.p1 TRINITY_DN16362_c0_g1~~TRINITY_DN16362_c0_g1_i1.p1  ORF type:complete len:368 (-),score=35.84 TRINITY_DN16362_c0_g1_i1:14-1117(-)